MHMAVSLMPSATSLRALRTLKPAWRIAAWKLVALGSIMNGVSLGKSPRNAAMSAT